MMTSMYLFRSWRVRLSTTKDMDISIPLGVAGGMSYVIVISICLLYIDLFRLNTGR